MSQTGAPTKGPKGMTSESESARKGVSRRSILRKSAGTSVLGLVGGSAIAGTASAAVTSVRIVDHEPHITGRLDPYRVTAHVSIDPESITEYVPNEVAVRLFIDGENRGVQTVWVPPGLGGRNVEFTVQSRQVDTVTERQLTVRARSLDQESWEGEDHATVVVHPPPTIPDADPDIIDVGDNTPTDPSDGSGSDDGTDGGGDGGSDNGDSGDGCPPDLIHVCDPPQV